MSKYLRTNEKDSNKETDVARASWFAQQVLSRVGGSCVYIAPKDKKLVDLEPIK